MNIIDIIILICCVPAIVRGLQKGFIAQAIALIALVAGAWLSFKFSEPLGNWLKDYMDLPGTVLQVISFALILVIVLLALTMLGKVLEKMVKFVMLGWLDKTLGILFALLKVTLALGLVIIMLDALQSSFQIIPQETVSESVLHNPVKSVAEIAFPYLKALIFSK